MMLKLSDCDALRYMRTLDRGREREMVTSRRYLGIKVAMVNTQVENLMEDYRRGADVKHRLAGKMKESQELRMMMSRLAQNKNS